MIEHIYPFTEQIDMPTSVTIAQGKEQTLNFTLLPEEADLEALQWTCSDENVATVDAGGLCKALNKGTATITVTSTDGSGVTATCEVTVTEATGIEGLSTSDNVGVAYYTTDGVRLTNNPQQGGIYIRQQGDKRKKVVIKRR